MTSTRNKTRTLCGLCALAFALGAAGCDTVFDPPPSACLRMVDHLASCTESRYGSNLGVPWAQLCQGDINAASRELSVVADCITSLSCEELIGNASADFWSSPECAGLIEFLGAPYALYGQDITPHLLKAIEVPE